MRNKWGRKPFDGLLWLLHYYPLVLLGLGGCWAVGYLLWLAAEPWLALMAG